MKRNTPKKSVYSFPPTPPYFRFTRFAVFLIKKYGYKSIVVTPEGLKMEGLRMDLASRTIQILTVLVYLEIRK